jgi:hypothetical protein
MSDGVVVVRSMWRIQRAPRRSAPHRNRPGTLYVLPIVPNLAFKNTRQVVKTEKSAPNPTTTRYPTVGESGVAPPKYVSFPRERKKEGRRKKR